LNDVVIVGGGISGLATAYYLSRRGLSTVLVEGQRRLGGLISTDRINGCRLEAGPDSYIANKPAVSELAKSIPGLSEQIMSSNDAARRIFVVRKGKLVSMPRGMVMMVPAEWGPALRSPLFEPATKLRFAREYFQSPKRRDEDVTIAEFIKDHFDEALLEYVTEPLLAGVYGGEAAKLSARSVLPRFVGYEQKYGSLIRGVRRERRQSAGSGPLFLSFQGGMQTLVDGLERSLEGNVRIVQGRARQVERHSTGNWRVIVGDGVEEARNLVLAIPAFRAADLIQGMDTGLANDLHSIPYSSAITVMVGYRHSDVKHPLNGFGFLAPKPERRKVAACTWINTKFPTRVAPEFVVLRAFIVDRDADELTPASDAEIVETARAELERLMGIKSSVEFSTVHRWPKSMPQYTVGHEDRQQRIGEQIRNYARLHLVGNAYDGVGIPDCVRLAKTAADRIASSR
jgi:protoporphyrinogen/coproporphyrinogen III oxidase